MLAVHQFPARSDNYGALVHDGASGATASIDAPDTEAVLAALAETGWTLTHILTTHHHPDHVAGNADLKERFGCEIIGPGAEADRIPGIDRQVAGGDTFDWAGHRVEVIDTPGHTAGHVVFHLPEHHLLFAGDTMFAMGCGRLFEGTADDMWGSLSRLMRLPDETTIYAGHEYTLSNARFAVTVDPDNETLRERLAEVERLRAENKPTLPTTLAKELATNPFLRAGDRSIRSGLAMMDEPDAAVFAELRRRKDAA